MADENMVVGIITLFVLYTVVMCIFMFASYGTYTKVTNWFAADLIEEGKKNGWDTKRVILPLIARNIPAIIILGSFAEAEFMTTLVSYAVSFFILKALATFLKNKPKS